MMARMEPSTFGLQAAGAGGHLPEAWQALLASQASTLAALVSRMRTAAAAMRQRQPPAARWQALAAEAERVLSAQPQERRWLGGQPLSRDLSRAGRHRRSLGPGDAPRAGA